MGLEAKEGEVVTDGKNVTIGAPCVKATGAGMDQPPAADSEDTTAQSEQKE